MDPQQTGAQVIGATGGGLCSGSAAGSAVGGAGGGQHMVSAGSRHIIAFESIQINKELGVGEFGVVQQVANCLVGTNRECLCLLLIHTIRTSDDRHTPLPSLVCLSHSCAKQLMDHPIRDRIESPVPPPAGAKEHLPYKSGDIITVLDKCGQQSAVNNNNITNNNHSSSLSMCSNATSVSSMAGGGHDNAGTLWKGALNNGKTGYFNPSDCVSYLGQNLPTSSSQSLSTSTSGGIGGAGGRESSSATSTLASHVLQSKFIRGFLDSRHNSGGSHSSTGGQSAAAAAAGNQSPYGSRRRIRPDMISRPQGDLVHTG
ncbi:unnamed protein product, partial [Medioppia subpectinata]